MDKKIMNQQWLPIVIAVIVAGGLGFWGGLRDGQNQAAKTNNPVAFQGQNGTRRGAGGTGMRGGASGGFVSGEIASLDGQSLTLKLRDGGSKIVILSDKTTVNKTVAGAATDLQIGQQVMTSGATNADGSLTADMIQIRPAMTATGQPSSQPTQPTGQTSPTPPAKY